MKCQKLNPLYRADYVFQNIRSSEMGKISQKFWEEHFRTEESVEAQFQRLEDRVRQTQTKLDDALKKIQSRDFTSGAYKFQTCYGCIFYDDRERNIEGRCFERCGQEIANKLTSQFAQVQQIAEKVELLQDKAGKLLLDFVFWFTEWSKDNTIGTKNLGVFWPNRVYRESILTIIRHCPNQRTAAATEMATWDEISGLDFLIAQKHLDQTLLDAIGLQALKSIVYTREVYLLVLEHCSVHRDLAVSNLLKVDISARALQVAANQVLPEQADKLIDRALEDMYQKQEIWETILELYPHRRVDVLKRVHDFRDTGDLMSGILEIAGGSVTSKKEEGNEQNTDIIRRDDSQTDVNQITRSQPTINNNPSTNRTQMHQRLLKYYGK